MFASTLVDPDIIDHPELSNIYAGFIVMDDDGNSLLPVPFQEPDMADGRGRRPRSEDQLRIYNALCAWGVRAFLTARAAGKSPDEARELLEKHAPPVATAESTRTVGRRVCQEVFGVKVPQLTDMVKNHVEAMRTNLGEKAVEANMFAELSIYANLGRTYHRSLGHEARLYEAHHGRQPGDFHDKMADAINPLPREEHFPLFVAAQLSYLTGVNVATVWQDQWHYRLVLGTAAALNPWTRRAEARLRPEEFYTLFRCVESADPDDESGHGRAKQFIAEQVGDRADFLQQAEAVLHDMELLPDRPLTVFLLMRHCRDIVGEDGEPARVDLLGPPR